MSAQPVILQVSPSTEQLYLYERYECAINLEAEFSNPYDYEQILVQGRFTSPSGQDIHVDGFYMEGYALDDLGQLRPEENRFVIRFAPANTGRWTCVVTVTDRNGQSNSGQLAFEVMADSATGQKGFVRTSPTHYLQFDTGSPYIPLGYNMCWHNRNPVTDYRQWLDSMAAHGGNYIRLWHAHWGLGLEWSLGWGQFRGLGRYNQQNARYQDWLLDYCHQKDIYLMLCLQHHGQLSTRVNPEWDTNPYNVKNGGPCNRPQDFFTNEQAIAFTKNRLRYVIARWGHHTSIMAWELMNEVEWTDGFEDSQQEVMLWHAEMASFIKSKDPYGHLITTSFAKAENDPLTWGNTEIGLTQIHHYGDELQLEEILARHANKYLGKYHKPVLVGEFGTGQAEGLAKIDPGGIHIHNGMWASLMGGSVGVGMPWWWDTYLHPQQLFGHLPAIAAVIRQTPFLSDNMSPAPLGIFGSGRAYVLIGESGTTAAGWIHNPEYRHQTMRRKGLPDPVRSTQIILNGLSDTTLYIRWINCLSGAVVAVDSILPDNGTASIAPPSFVWDLAFVMSPEPVSPASQDVVKNMGFQVFPNPVRAGESVTISLPPSVFPNVTVELLDASGRRVLIAQAPGTPEFEQAIPAGLTPGLYWWRISSIKAAGVRPIMVTQ